MAGRLQKNGYHEQPFLSNPCFLSGNMNPHVFILESAVIVPE